MISPYAFQAIEDALAHGKALLKFISRNDVGDTNSHQRGYYLPLHDRELYTDLVPEKGKSKERPVKVIWCNGMETESAVKWYGVSKREFRLTRFGKGFPYMDRENVGSLMVIVPVSFELFHAYVLDFDEDIEAVQTSLGVQLIGREVGVYSKVKIIEPESESACILRHISEYTAKHAAQFPNTADVSEAARQALFNCIKKMEDKPLDDRLMKAIRVEYDLFKMLERVICGPQITTVFKDIDDFLQVAQKILQRRKSRAGTAFQNQVEFLLKERKLPFDAQPEIDGNPDFIFPSRDAYLDASFPTEKLFCLALKTSCKDRWKQVLDEAKRIPKKHIFTLQPGISVSQLILMKDRNVSLVVPEPLHSEYNVQDSGIELLTFEQFVENVSATV